MINIKRYMWTGLLFLMIPVMLLGNGCQCAPPTGDYDEGTHRYSFETGMQGWQSDGADLDNPPVEWSIERSQYISSDGDYSVELYLNNLNDAGKIWVERVFRVLPDQPYSVDLKYDFASRDWGDINLWTIISGAVPAGPDVAPVFQGNTGNNAEQDAGYVWLDKSYHFETMSNSDGEIMVMIGIWGTWETARTYYLDKVEINIDRSSESVPPKTPAGLELERERYDPAEGKYGDRVFLSWEANDVSDVKEYRIYRSLARIGGGEDLPQTPYELIATTSESGYVDQELSVSMEYPTTVYYYRVSAVDSAGNESELSEPVSIEYTPFG